MDLGLKGKHAIITGGSDGIGFAVADALAQEGVEVLICARDKEHVESSAKRIAESRSVKAIGVSCDVVKREDIERTVSVAESEFGQVEFLINNAGTGTSETIMDAADEKWYRHWDLHVMAAIRFTRLVVPLMKKAGEGVILNTSSICAKQPLGYEPIYNVTKAALSMLGKCMSNEFVKDNIRVNNINPGLVETRDWRKTAKILSEETEQSPEDYLKGVAEYYAPINRFSSPEEIAPFYVFLCSNKASYSVGSSYYIDGGMLNVVE